jgi:hypothetical protein
LDTVPKKPWSQQLKLWSPLPKDLSLFELFLRPWPLIVYPEVIFSTLATAFALAWVVGINILNSFVLQAPPYSWSPAVNGLINIPCWETSVVHLLVDLWLIGTPIGMRERMAAFSTPSRD